MNRTQIIEWVLGKLPVQKRKILFISHLGRGYGCNPKYICEYLLSHHPSEFVLHWVFDPSYSEGGDIPQGVIPVNLYSKRFRYDILTCGLLVSNTRIPQWFGFRHRKGQRYLQTWHSSLRLKKIEGDAILDKTYRDAAIVDSGMTDAIISGCRFSSNTIKRAFWYDGPILEVGTPRIDYLLSQTNQSKEQLYVKAGLDPNYHYLLYAPTFRNSGSVEVYDIDTKRLSCALEQKFGTKWRVLVRLHPNLQGKIITLPFGRDCLDMTNYPDMQELLVVADILITDFSSCMFDMALMRKPCFLYASDLVQYMQDERAFYFPLKSLPFPMAVNMDEMCTIINNFEMDIYLKGIASFLKDTGSFETGAACTRIYNYIIQK